MRNNVTYRNKLLEHDPDALGLELIDRLDSGCLTLLPKSASQRHRNGGCFDIM